MGGRAIPETLAAILGAFWRQRTWKQSDLAREADVSPRVVRQWLDRCSIAGWPLEREEDPPHIYWSLPKSWFPGGVLLPPADIAALLRVVARSPSSPERAQLVRTLAVHAPRPLRDTLTRVTATPVTDAAEPYLSVFEDAAAQRVPARIRYFSASSRLVSNRTISVQRVLVSRQTRIVAYCHTRRGLRWFRLVHVQHAALESGEAFVVLRDEEVDAFVRESVDGYHGDVPTLVRFFVRNPEAQWVAANLPEGLSAAPGADGLLVEATTAGLQPVARFVVGLGDAAVCQSPELRSAVHALARGALRDAPQE